MDQNIIRQVEEKYKKAEIPEFNVGDTIDVHQKIVEGNRTRIQVFNGVVIGRKGGGVNASFTVRRIVNNEGVEKIFLLHSPLVAKIEVKRRGKIRRAKLYFLRGRVGKARRLREKRVQRVKRDASQATQAVAPAVETAEPANV